MLVTNNPKFISINTQNVDDKSFMFFCYDKFNLIDSEGNLLCDEWYSQIFDFQL